MSLVDDYVKIKQIENFSKDAMACLSDKKTAINCVEKSTKLSRIYEDLFFKLNMIDRAFEMLKFDLEEQKIMRLLPSSQIENYLKEYLSILNSIEDLLIYKMDKLSLRVQEKDFLLAE